MQVVPAEEENDAEVRREDQDKINRFARLNARVHELRSERDLIQVSTIQLKSKFSADVPASDYLT